MPVPVRQSILWAVVGVFLGANFFLSAFFWYARTFAPLAFAATGALAAEPLLIAAWFGLARQPLRQRLKLAIGLSLAASAAFVLGALLANQSLNAGVYVFFLVSGVGGTMLAGGFFRALRFLLGVLTQSPAAGLAALEPLEGIPLRTAAAETPTSEAVLSESYSVASAREFQFGVGYIITMTSAIAIMMSVLRLIAASSQGPSWDVIFLFGWVFFGYSLLAALVTIASILCTRYPGTLKIAAVAYTLLAPLLALFIVSLWEVRVIDRSALFNLYAFALSLHLTLALVAQASHRLGYRLRHGWL